MWRWILVLLVTIMAALPVSASAQTRAEPTATEQRFLDPDEVVALGRAYRLRRTQSLVGHTVVAASLLAVHEIDGDYLDDYSWIVGGTLLLNATYIYSTYATARTSYWLDEAGLDMPRARMASWVLGGGGAFLVAIGSAAWAPGITAMGGLGLFGAMYVIPFVQSINHGRVLSGVPVGHEGFRPYLAALPWLAWASIPFALTVMITADSWTEHDWVFPLAGGTAATLSAASIWTAQSLSERGTSISTVPMSISLVAGIAAVAIAGRDAIDADYWMSEDARPSWALAALSVLAAGAQSYLNMGAIEGLELNQRAESVDTPARGAQWIVAPTVVQRSAGVGLAVVF